MVLYTWWKLFSFVISFVLVTHLVYPSWHLGAPLRGPWVSPWSKPHTSTDIKKKKKIKTQDRIKVTVHLTTNTVYMI